MLILGDVIGRFQINLHLIFYVFVEVKRTFKDVLSIVLERAAVVTSVRVAA